MEYVANWELFVDMPAPDESKQTGFDMVPQMEREQLVCMTASRLVPQLSYEEAYYRLPYGEVIRRLALVLASQYKPPEDDAQAPPPKR